MPRSMAEGGIPGLCRWIRDWSASAGSGRSHGPKHLLIDMTKEVSVLVGAGSIGMAIARRVGAGRLTVLADYSIENADKAAPLLTGTATCNT